MLIGLTGGIASGKSSVAQILEGVGIPVVDADEVCRAVQVPGTFLFSQIVEAFGPEVLNAAGELDRMALGKKVFQDPEALDRLNQLTHPVIWAEMQQRVGDLLRGHGVVVAMVPLLLENGRQDWVDEVWVVSVPPDLQKARLMARNALTEAEAMARIQSQMPLEEKLARATRVVDNSGTLEQTRAQVEGYLQQLGVRA